MSIALTIIRIILYICSILFLVLSIILKDKKSLSTVMVLCVTNIFYLILFGYFFYLNFVIDVNLGFIVVMVALGVAGILNIISTIIASIRFKKISGQDSNKLKNLKLGFVLLPVVLFAISLVYEYSQIMDADIVIESYYSQMFDGEHYYHVIKDGKVKEVNISTDLFLKLGKKYSDIYSYDISYENGELVYSEYYEAIEENFNLEIVKDIFKKEDFDEAYVYGFVGTNYYIFEYNTDESYEYVLYDGTNKVSDLGISDEVTALYLFK